MEKVQAFIDNMFMGLQKTDEMLAAKHSITEMMEDKFDALLKEGKNENEALGILVSEFGNIDELIRDFEINQKENATNENLFSEEEPAPYYSNAIPEDFMEEYREFNRKFSIAIAVGVVMCIAAVTAFIVTANLFSNALSFLPFVFFFSLIASAVAIFIYFGMQKEQYDKLYKQYETARLNSSPIDKNYNKRKQLAEAISGIVMLLATGAFLFSGFILKNWHPAWVVFPIGGILCSIVNISLGVKES